jgi:hypothetical protein
LSRRFPERIVFGLKSGHEKRVVGFAKTKSFKARFSSRYRGSANCFLRREASVLYSMLLEHAFQ